MLMVLDIYHHLNLLSSFLNTLSYYNGYQGKESDHVRNHITSCLTTQGRATPNSHLTQAPGNIERNPNDRSREQRHQHLERRGQVSKRPHRPVPRHGASKTAPQMGS